MTEEELVKLLKSLYNTERKDVFLGIGDDAAAVRPCGDGYLLLIAADQVVENVHFTPETDPRLVAQKLLNRNISDIAAMGGCPKFALVTVLTDDAHKGDYLIEFQKGLAEAAEKSSVAVIGGDVSSLPSEGFAASLTIVGFVKEENVLRRDAARDGDSVYATGEFGKSFPTNHHLTFTPRVAEGKFIAGKYAKCAIDVSDGLLKDSLRMADESGLALRLYLDNIPRRADATLEEALCDGEDYELVFAVPQDKTAELEKEWKKAFPDTKLSRIGKFVSGEKGKIVNTLLPSSMTGTGYDHFGGKFL